MEKCECKHSNSCHELRQHTRAGILKCTIEECLFFQLFESYEKAVNNNERP